MTGSASAFAIDSLEPANGPGVGVKAASAGGLGLRVDAVDGTSTGDGQGSTIAAISTAPMAPGEQRRGEFSISLLGRVPSLVTATIVTTELHGGRPGGGCFRYRLHGAGRPDPDDGATPYAGTATQLLDGGDVAATWQPGTTRRFRLTIAMADDCASRTGRPVSGSLQVRLNAAAA